MSHPHHSHDDPDAAPPVRAADASVRTARHTDAPAIGMVQDAVFRAAYADVLPAQAIEQFDPQRFAAAWRQALTDPPSSAHRVLVACAGEQVVGFAALGPAADGDAGLPEGAGEVYVMGVHPEARRVGHGSRLLNASGDTLRAGDHRALVTWTLASDEGVRSFCAAGGFEPDGAWRERVVDTDGRVAREVRLLAHLGQ